jgi:hypothetical protein
VILLHGGLPGSSELAGWRFFSHGTTSGELAERPGYRTGTLNLPGEARLMPAARILVPCPPVRDLLPDGSAETAYAVQSVVTRTDWTAVGGSLATRSA